MKFADPYVIRVPQKKGTILFASNQLIGPRPRQEDYIANVNDECFVIADGGGGMPHGELAAKLASETAVWAYRHIGKRAYYWEEKEKLLRRIFRTTNMRVWQKRREDGFEDGLATSLLVCVVSSKKFWIGSVGDTSAFLFRDGLIDLLTKADIDDGGYVTNVVGAQRLGLVPQIVSEQMVTGDCLLLATNGVTNFSDEEDMRASLEGAGTTNESVTNALIHILRTAEDNGSTDTMTACLVKRI